MTPPGRQEVMAALSAVLDPCSCQTGSPVDVVELGLIESVEIDDTTVSVTLLPTSPMCMYVGHMTEEIRRRVSDIGGAEEVVVKRETETLWTPVRMAEALRRERRERFRERLRKEDIEPYEFDPPVTG